MAPPWTTASASRTRVRHVNRTTAGDDAVVVAVIDSAFTPYHWDYYASKMPQAKDSNPNNNLPLGKAPHRWLRGFPSPRAFDSYNALDLSLAPKNKLATIQMLDAKDTNKWQRVKESSRKKLHYYWMPDTKVIGALTFSDDKIHGDENAHGTGTTSVSVGNIHGSCPECLLLFIQYGTAKEAEAAIEWAMEQEWIDAISNSYGFGTVGRDRIYSKSDVKAQRAASRRGQTIFFSAGNGLANTFTAPNPTLLSSQEGPDWIVTVGAVSPKNDGLPGTGDHASYTGHGKPADIASLGDGYPSAYGSASVSGSGDFGGTSNATPVIAGTYARALFVARRALPGPSRIQRGGLVARGWEFSCGNVRPRCELRDGGLTVSELRRRLFHGAIHTKVGMTASIGRVGELPPLGDDEYMNEGHGTYFGRETSDKAWMKEFRRITGPMMGRAKTLKRAKAERKWMTVDSWCRQHIWGRWDGGYYEKGDKFPRSGTSHPLRTAYIEACPALQPTP